MKHLLIILSLLITTAAYSQDNEPYYYVSAANTSITEDTTATSAAVLSLSKHDNLRLISLTDNWAQVRYKNRVGHVPLQDIRPGQAVVTRTSYRAGAICKDGSRSSATGRGACSHHKGVSRWVTQSRESVRIRKN